MFSLGFSRKNSVLKQATGISCHILFQSSFCCPGLLHKISTFSFFFLSGVGLSPLGTAATSGLLYKHQMIDEGDCGAIGGMKIGRGN
jgi:hypothetical protein